MRRTPLHLLSALLSALALACSTGEDVSDSTDGTGDASTAAATTATSAATSEPTGGTTGAPTTGEPGTSTTTTGEPTTGGATLGTTGDATAGSTGEICDVGTANCACDNGTCQDGLVCDNDVCVTALVCDNDMTEPDDDEPSAHMMGQVTDDDAMVLMADGVITGLSDVDWYSYHATDTAFHVAEPTVKVTSSGTLRVCQFLECEEGGAVMTEITCPMGTQSALSGALRPGCCGGATFSVSDFNCPGSTDNLFVYVRLDKALSDECIEYSLTVHN